MLNSQQRLIEQQMWLLRQKQQLLSKLKQTKLKQTHYQPLDAAQISANYAVLLLSCLEQQQLDTQQMRERLKAQHPDFEQPQSIIPYQDYAELVLEALRLSQDPHFGLIFGQRLNLSTHGFLGFAVMSSPDLSQAADLAQTYIKIRNQLIDIRFAKLEDNEAIFFECQIEHPALYRFEIETSLSSLYHVWLSLFGSKHALKGVSINYQPNDLGRLQHYFNMPVLSEQAGNCIRFDGQALANFTNVNDGQLSQVAQQQCQQVLQQLEHMPKPAAQNLSLQVQEVLLSQPGFAKQSQVAHRLNLSTRSLSRRLAQEGQSFSHIVDELRQQLARQCLSSSSWTIDDISSLLGYSDASNFNRAFKRKHQQSASDYRSAKQP